MNITKIIELLSYSLPAIITGFVAYYFFQAHTKNEERRIKLSLLKKNQAKALPIRLQAYERMTLFLERINPSKLLLRISPSEQDKHVYSQHLISVIEQEFEHNIAQQIYISNACWSVIITAKNAIIETIKNFDKDDVIKNGSQLREAILQKMAQSTPPSVTALNYLKEEVRDLI